MICPFCKEEILDGAIKCKHCGSMLGSATSDSPKYLAGNIIGLLGSSMMIVGLFLPWATLGIISVSGWTKAEDSKILLVLGIAIALFSILGLAQKKIYPYIFVLLSFGSLGLLAYLYYSLQENLSGNEILGVSAQIGGGFWLSLVGAVVVLLGAAAMVSKKKKK